MEARAAYRIGASRHGTCEYRERGRYTSHMRRDERTLPLEFRGELGYRDLVAALEGLAGEHVFVGLTLGAKPMFHGDGVTARCA